jgi:hypothetical protein
MCHEVEIDIRIRQGPSSQKMKGENCRPRSENLLFVRDADVLANSLSCRTEMAGLDCRYFSCRRLSNLAIFGFELITVSVSLLLSVEPGHSTAGNMETLKCFAPCKVPIAEATAIKVRYIFVARAV